MDPYRETPRSHPAVPIAIVIGFSLVALAIFFTGKGDTDSEQIPTNISEEDIISGIVRTVDETDYIKGNPNAPILMIEYSDYDCPFCKQYHETLTQIMNEYGITGRVAWVYRQFPLEQLHPNSPKISEAALCVGSLGGSAAFWKFTDAIFASRELEEPTNMITLPDFATEAGVDKAAYQACVSSGQMKDAVKASTEEVLGLGAKGTPYTVLVVGSEQAVVNGAQPYDVVKSIIDNLISQLDGGIAPQDSTATTTP
ncbi:MAG: thioredoxin domain-containing protein [Patescibacteria group bacterium]